MCSSLNPHTMVIIGSLLSVFFLYNSWKSKHLEACEAQEPRSHYHLKGWLEVYSHVVFPSFLDTNVPLLYISPMTSDPGVHILKTIVWTPKKEKCGCGKVNSTLDFRLEPEPYCWLNQIEHELPWMSSQDFKGPFFNCRCTSLIEMWAKLLNFPWSYSVPMFSHLVPWASDDMR